MFYNTILICYAIIAFLSPVKCKDAVDGPISLSSATGFSGEITRNVRQSFCFTAREDNFNIAAIFNQVNIVVKSSEPFNWHSVRGVSSDDFHSVIEEFVFGFFLSPEEKLKLKAKHNSEDLVFEKTSMVRDLVSSCPSPLAYQYNTCNMQFSPYGRACVSIKSDKSIHVQIDTFFGFNFRRLLHLLAGLALLILSHTLSKSKIFQYSTGSFLFMIAGLLVIAYIFINRKPSFLCFIAPVHL